MYPYGVTPVIKFALDFPKMSLPPGEQRGFPGAGVCGDQTQWHLPLHFQQCGRGGGGGGGGGGGEGGGGRGG